MDSCISLASLDTREESLVALQMMSPLQEWKFPTVMQNLMQKLCIQSVPFHDRGVIHSCVGDDQNACPFKSVDVQTIRVHSAGEDVCFHEKRTNERSFLADKSRIVSMRASIPGSNRLSFEESSSLGGLSMSLNIPSLRLSCDTNSSLRNVSFDKNSKNCSQPSQSLSRARFNSNLPGDVIKSQMSNKETVGESNVFHDIHDNSVTTEDVNIGGDSDPAISAPKLGYNSEEVLIASGPHTASRKQGTCEKRDKDHVKEATNKVENKSIHHDCDALYKGGSTANKTINQGIEETVDEWLEESSFDRWSFVDRIHSVTHCETKNEEHSRRISQGVNPNTTQGDSHSSIADTTYEFPSDMPFSEDLDQFLEDVEEKYMMSKKRDKEFPANHLDNEKHIKTSDRIARTTLEGNSKEPCKCPSLPSDASTSANKQQTTSELQREQHTNCEEQQCVGLISCKRDEFTMCFSHVNESCANSSNISDHVQLQEQIDLKDSVCYGDRSGHVQLQEQIDLKDSVCYGDRSGSVRMIKNSFLDQGGSKICYKDVGSTDTKDIYNLVEEKREVERLGQGLPCDFDGTSDERERIEVVKSSQDWLESSNDNSENSHCAEESSEMGHDDDTDADFVIPDSPDFIACSQSPVLFSQSQSPIACSEPSTSRHLCATQQQLLSFHQRQAVQSFLKSCPSGAKASEDEVLSSETHQKENRSPIESSSIILSPNGGSSCSPEQYEGTPALFSQASESENQNHTQHSTVFPRRLPRMPLHKKKATPFRELFMQRAKSWKMSSTPRTTSKNRGVRSPMESPTLFGTPDLFSAENSPDIDHVFYQSEGKEKCSDESQSSDLCGSFECTPDLF